MGYSTGFRGGFQRARAGHSQGTRGGQGWPIIDSGTGSRFRYAHSPRPFSAQFSPTVASRRGGWLSSLVEFALWLFELAVIAMVFAVAIPLLLVLMVLVGFGRLCGLRPDNCLR